MVKSKWIFKDNVKTPYYLTESNSIDIEVAKILITRGIDTNEKVKKFINSTVENISTKKMFDVEKSAKRILEAIRNKEKIYVYGDYDVDGVTSTSITYLALKKIGANVDYYIPLRDEGYGLNYEAVTLLKDNGCNLIITVDCGISSYKEIEFTNTFNIDVIITDHHEIPELLPNAYSIVNPKIEKNDYEFKYLAGCGTVFMLLKEIYTILNKENEIYRFLEIVAIGTVADIVPLVEENRIFVKEGLKQLVDTKNIGLKTLIKLLYQEKKEKLSTYDIGFVIAPTFNAAGRLEDAKLAVDLLVTESKEKATLIAKKLIDKNFERRNIQEGILKNVEKKIEKENLHKNNVIIAFDSSFHHGVIGIVASKIVDKYYKPAIIMELKEQEGIAVASCRSIENFNITNALASMKDLFLKFGGHAAAAGFSIEIDKIDEFKKKMESYISSTLKEEDFYKKVTIDKEVLPYNVSIDFYKKIEILEPFGFGNSTPIFHLSNNKITEARVIGRDLSHLLFNIENDSVIIKNCVWFGNAKFIENLKKQGSYDIAFKLKLDEFKNRFYPKVYVEDVKKSSNIKNFYKYSTLLYNNTFPIFSVIYSKTFIEAKDVYIKDNYIVKNISGTIGFLPYETTLLLSKLQKNYNYTYYGEIIQCKKTENNYQVSLKIYIDMSFTSREVTDSKHFKQIKEFLIGNFNYTSLQKKVLVSIFKHKKNTLLVASKKRGINTIISTIALFFNLHQKKVLLITKNKYSKKINNYLKISNNYIGGYDFYIYDNVKPLHKQKNVFVFFSKDIDLEGFSKIEDHFILPKNIKILTEKELIETYTKGSCYYSKKLSLRIREEVLCNIDKHPIIYATEDIYAAL